MPDERVDRRGPGRGPGPRPVFEFDDTVPAGGTLHLAWSQGGEWFRFRQLIAWGQVAALDLEQIFCDDEEQLVHPVLLQMFLPVAVRLSLELRPNPMKAVRFTLCNTLDAPMAFHLEGWP